MKKTYVIIGIILTILVVAIIQRKNVGLLLGKYNLINNSIKVVADKDVNSDSLYIFWKGKTEFVDEKESNLLLIYHRKVQMSIPPSYGDNIFIVRYGNKTLDKIGFFKSNVYSKHNFNFKFKLAEKKIFIKWKITSWLGNENYQGCDTLYIE